MDFVEIFNIRMDAMLQEMRALRKEIQEIDANKHIIDKKV